MWNGEEYFSNCPKECRAGQYVLLDVGKIALNKSWTNVMRSGISVAVLFLSWWLIFHYRIGLDPLPWWLIVRKMFFRMICPSSRSFLCFSDEHESDGTPFHFSSRKKPLGLAQNDWRLMHFITIIACQPRYTAHKVKGKPYNTRPCVNDIIFASYSLKVLELFCLLNCSG